MRLIDADTLKDKLKSKIEEVIDSCEEQAVPISELKNLREEMGNITDIKTYHERNLIWTCLCMLDNLIESYEEESAD